MYNKVYEKKEYIIFKVKEGYVIYNAKKEFSKGHTHFKNFNASCTLIDIILKKKIPKSTNFYFLDSIIRLSTDESYIEKIEEYKETKQAKTKNKYRNKPKKK